MSSSFRAVLKCDCGVESFPRIQTGINPELGRIVICMHCLRKYVYWNNSFHELGKEVKDGRTKDSCGR
jgi:hypothetical protein